MPSAKMLKRALAEAQREVLRFGPIEQADDCIADLAADLLYDWECEAAEDREMHGEPEDSPCLQSCDDWGSGEGRFHGRM